MVRELNKREIVLNERVVGLPEVDEFREVVELENKVL